MNISHSIRNLSKEYVPGKPALRGISLDIEGRDITAIVGRSGTGKSPSVRSVRPRVVPDTGTFA